MTTVQHPDVTHFQHGPFPRGSMVAMNVPALGTPPIEKPEAVKAPDEAKIIPNQPRWVFVYFFKDGGVAKLSDEKPDMILYEQAYLVMVSVPARHNQAAYVEIIKADHGASSIIMTASVPVRQGEDGSSNDA